MKFLSNKYRVFACLLLFLSSANSYCHGLTSASAEISVRPHNLIEVQVQFDLMALLNHNSDSYSLPLLASLNKKEFGVLYGEVVKLFDQRLIVKNKGTDIKLHRRFPTQDQVFDLLKRQFIESTMAAPGATIPYTYSDRRFYQKAFFDFRLNSTADLKHLEIIFPKELGDIYVTYSEPKTNEIHRGDAWSYALVSSRPKAALSRHHK